MRFTILVTANSRNITHAVNDACPDVFHHLNTDFHPRLPEVHGKTIDNICSMLRQRIHSTGMDSSMAQPHNDHGSFDWDSLNYIPKKLIEHPQNSFNPLFSFVAAIEASMRFWPILPMGGSAIASSSQPVPCSDSKTDSNDITSIINITSIKNTGLVNGSTIVEGAMLLGG